VMVASKSKVSFDQIAAPGIMDGPLQIDGIGDPNGCFDNKC
jgi:hypothetical protein